MPSAKRSGRCCGELQRAPRSLAQAGQQDRALDALRVHLVEQLGQLAARQHRIARAERVLLDPDHPVGGLLVPHVDVHQAIDGARATHETSMSPGILATPPALIAGSRSGRGTSSIGTSISTILRSPRSGTPAASDRGAAARPKIIEAISSWPRRRQTQSTPVSSTRRRIRARASPGSSAVSSARSSEQRKTPERNHREQKP